MSSNAPATNHRQHLCRRLALATLAWVGSALALQAAWAQDLSAEVKANLLKEQAISAVKTGDTSAFFQAMDDFRVLEKQGAKVPPGLFLAEAETATSRNEIMRAERAFNDYFRVAPPEGDAYGKALSVYAEFKHGIAGPIWPRLESMVVVPAGTLMPVQEPGTADGAATTRALGIPVRQFALARHEVTRAEFLEFMNATNHVMAPPAEPGTGACGPEQQDWRKPGFEQTDEDPVVCVSWDDARAYVDWLNQLSGLRFRLPTEAEWDYAARAGQATDFWYGGDFDPAKDNGPGAAGADKWERGTAPVGSFPANPFDLQDMLGNVSEWTADCGDTLAAATTASTDAAAERFAACATRVVRGGDWNSDGIKPGAAARQSLPPGNRFNYVGFRIAIDL